MKHRFFAYIERVGLLTAMFCIIISCGQKKFRITGEIAGADNDLITLEKADFNGRWNIIDSTRTSSSGSFNFEREPFTAPEILRLTLNGQQIYLPVDSIETISLKADAQNFARSYSLAGSANAVAMDKFDHELMALNKNISSDSLENFKKTVYTKYIQPSPGSIIGYYILTKDFNGKALFTPFEGNDYKYFAAVATGFQQHRPNDPRTKMLEQTGIQAMKEKNIREGRRIEMHAEETGAIEITLPDENGNNVKLTDILAKGKPTLLVFSMMTLPDSHQLNYELSQIQKSKGNSFNIYQVSFDFDRYLWRDAARNLPWTTVYDADGEYSPTAVAYNLSELPSYFIYDAAGNLTTKAQSLEEIKKRL